MLSRNLPLGSDQHGQVLDQNRMRFHVFISKMLLFPFSTFFLWLLPLLNLLIFIKYDSFYLELVVTAVMNSQGLKNAVLLLCTNALVRQEIHEWLCGTESSCFEVCCNSVGNRGYVQDEDDMPYSSFNRDENEYSREQNHKKEHALGGHTNDRDRAVTEDVLIGAVMGGPSSEEGSDYALDDGYKDFYEAESGSRPLVMRSSMGQESIHFHRNRNITPQLPSLNSSFDPK